MLAVNLDEGLVKLLRDLVRIPSVAPEDSTEEVPGKGEAELAGYVARYLGERGFEVSLTECLPGRPNLFAAFGPKDAKRTLAFEFHMDTVGVQNMTVPPFEGLVKDGKMFGRGTCDDKGPAAALLYALDTPVLKLAVSSGLKLVVVAVVGEEKGNIGAEKLVEGGFKADDIVVLEPTDLKIIRAHKGALWFAVEIIGRAAHGSAPQEGVNAIYGAMQFIEFLLEETARHAGESADDILGKPTVSIGSIRGGSHINVVPDRCVLEVDRRLALGEDPQVILQSVSSELQRMKQDGEIIDWRLRVQKMGKAFITNAESNLVKALQAACAQAGVDPEVAGAGWYSDAAVLAEACENIVVFGPGSILQAHTADEFVDLVEVRVASDIIRNLVEILAKS